MSLNRLVKLYERDTKSLRSLVQRKTDRIQSIALIDRLEISFNLAIEGFVGTRETHLNERFQGAIEIVVK